MKLEGGSVDVVSGVAFVKGEPMPLVRLAMSDDEGGGEIWMPPHAARKIGMDLISAAHQSLADSMIRVIAQETGLDGDGLIDRLRQITDAAFPDE